MNDGDDTTQELPLLWKCEDGIYHCNITGHLQTVRVVGQTLIIGYRGTFLGIPLAIVELAKQDAGAK